MAIKRVALTLLCMAVCVSAAAINTSKQNIDRSPTAWHNAVHDSFKCVERYFLLLPIVLVGLTAIVINYIHAQLLQIPGLAQAVERSKAARLAVVAQIKIDNARTKIERQASDAALAKIHALELARAKAARKSKRTF